MMALVGVQVQEAVTSLGISTRKEHNIGNLVFSKRFGRTREADSRSISRNEHNCRMTHLGIVPLPQ